MQILLLSQIEVNIAIISASAPTLRPLFNKVFQSKSYDQSNKYGAGSGGSGPASNHFRGHRVRSNGQMELHSFSANDPISKDKSMAGGNTRSTSEEFILGGEGITKTVETNVNVEQGYHKD